MRLSRAETVVLNHVSSAPVLGEEFPVNANRAPALLVLRLLDIVVLNPATTTQMYFPPPPTVPSLLPCSGTTVPMVNSLRSADPPVPDRETSC